MKIPYFGLNRQYVYLKDELLDATDRVLSTGRFMAGRFTEEFEDWLEKKNHSKHAIVCHSGTQALEIIAKYWYIGFQDTSQDTVAHVPTLTFPATANSFINSGWKLNLVDCNDFGQSTFEHEKQNSGIFVRVGLYGAAISSHNSKHILIEDGAQHWLSNNCKRIGHSTAISFDPTKNLPGTGNGGAIVTNDDKLNFWAREYQNHGKFEHNLTGTNSRMSELECAHLLVRAKYLDKWQLRRKQIVRIYNNAFNDSNHLEPLILDNEIDSHACHKYVLISEKRDELLSKLKEDGIECKVHYDKPLHELSCFKNERNLIILSQASRLCKKLISLPLYPDLEDSEIQYIIERVLCHTS